MTIPAPIMQLAAGETTGLPAGGAQAENRRSEDRAATMFRPILIEIGCFAGFCLVRNLSSKGLKGRIYAGFAPGQRARVFFDGVEAISGTVVWSADGEIGVQFDQPIDVGAVLAELARPLPRGRANRAPRLPIDCAGDLDIGGRTLSIDVQDISQRGLKVRTSFVRPGDEVIVRLPELDAHRASVRWATPGSAGLVFMRPIAFEDLAAWVIGRYRCGFNGAIAIG